MQRARFDAAPTVVGSFPHTDPDRLIGRILATLPELPAWPQLPVRDWLESMYVQYSEGLPGVTIDRASQKIWFRTDHTFQQELEGFYQALLDEDVERFAVSREYALGLHAFLARVKQMGAGRPQWVKGQVTGPFSFAMTVTDESKRAMAYTPELYEVAVQGMAMKARWMARRLLEAAPNALVVLDEPYLCSIGSAFVNVPRDDVIGMIDGAVKAIHKEGALAGLHCCGNTDWSLVLTTEVDCVNFDAYEYFQGLSLYPAELKGFLEKGGILSWGIVPTMRSMSEFTPLGLLEKLEGHLEALARKGVDRTLLGRQSLLTPSCGMGTQTVEGADHVLSVLSEVASRFRDRAARSLQPR